MRVGVRREKRKKKRKESEVAVVVVVMFVWGRKAEREDEENVRRKGVYIKGIKPG